MSIDAGYKYNVSRAYKTSITYNANTIMTGKCLVMDPSSAGSTSLPAYCIIDRGVIEDPVEIYVSEKLRSRGALVAHRLYEIGTSLRGTFGHTRFDLLAVELILHAPSANTVTSSFQKLNMSIGAIHASINAKYRIVIPAWEWHTLAPRGYVKSDLGDVRLMAEALLRDAKDYLDA